MRRNHPLGQFFSAPSPPPPPRSLPPDSAALQAMEDFIYQYQRNIREYNLNIRQLSNQLHELSTRPATTPSRVAGRTASFSVSFDTDVGGGSAAGDVELLERLHMSVATPEQEENTCPISLERFHAGEETCKIVGCGHVFKKEAALRWLRRTPVCPVCRYDLLSSQAAPADPAVSAPTETFLETIMQQFLRDVSGTNVSSNSNNSSPVFEFEVPLDMLRR